MTDPKNGDAAAQDSPEVFFRNALDGFDGDLDLAARLSYETNARFVKTRFGWASYVFARLVTVGMTLARLTADFRVEAPISTLDHTSIISLARCMMEASLMFSYLAERGLSAELWQLRRDILWLHDATTRYKMFKSFGNRDEMLGHKSNRNDLKSRIAGSKLFQLLQPEEKDRILAGMQMYIGGLRGAARIAGWDPNLFDGFYTYFSQFSHSAPVSFLRTEEHEINYLQPGAAQFGFAATALEHARKGLEICTRRMAEIFPDAVADHGFSDLRVETESPYSDPYIAGQHEA